MNERTDQSKLRKIGAGFLGTVWAPASGDAVAFKREDGGPGRSLLHDSNMQQHVLKSLPQEGGCPSTIHVPQHYDYITAKDLGWWNQNLIRYPTNYEPCNLIHAERIPPFPQHIRERLIDIFCPTELINVIKASDENRDCIVRPYLGKRRYQNVDRIRPSKLGVFSLRNFPLHVDQMEELGMDGDIGHYAEIMAETLATLHWLALVDANDVEFVLAPPRLGTDAKLSNFLGEHTLWLLDFDCCRAMSMDEEGVAKSVEAFFGNDPYYPRPGEASWTAFRETYLRTSSRIILEDEADYWRITLSQKFIEKVEEEQRRRDEQRGKRQRTGLGYE